MGKKTLSQHLMNAVLRLLFLGYAVAFAAWWYISPKGFPWNHLRFWSNNVIPIIIVCGSLVCFIGMFRKKRDLVAILIPSYPVATLAFVITGRILYPISMRIVFLVFLLCWLAVLIALALFMIRQQPIRKLLWIPTILLGVLSALTGAALPWSQQSCQAATKPLNPTSRPKQHSTLNQTQSPFELSNRVIVSPQRPGVLINDFNTQLRIYPLLTFYSKSLDRCWILFSPRSERIGKKRIFKGMRRIENGLYLEYTDEGQNVLEVRTFDTEGFVDIKAVCELPKPVYSHLNTFTEFSVKGREQIFVSFSPCPEKRIEVTPFDYPFGRPARLAYLDKTGVFRVVQAKSAEKGPFETLAESNLKKEEPLALTVYDGDNPVYRITFKDWTTQCSKQLSPTAGWGLPENAIEFSLDQEDKTKARFFITLASTSAGRGFDSVGHNTGVYRNQIRIETLILD